MMKLTETKNSVSKSNDGAIALLNQSLINLAKFTDTIRYGDSTKIESYCKEIFEKATKQLLI